MSTVDTELYVSVRELPTSCAPAFVVRDDGATLIMVTPWADRHDLLRAFHTLLDDYEQDALREALQWRDGHVPLDWLTEVGPMAVPEHLWLGPPRQQDHA